MKPPRAGGKKSSGLWTGAVLAVLMGWLVSSGIFGNKLETWSYEGPWFYRNDPVPGEVVIVFMDEESEAQLQQPSNGKWDRRIHARLLHRLKDEGSRTVLFDVMFNLPSDAEEDRLFAEAIRRHGKVVLGIDYTKAGDSGSTGLGKARRAVHPISLFADNAAGLGIVQVVPDTEPVVRRLFPGFARAGGGKALPTTTWKTAELEGAPVTKDLAGMERERWLNYYGAPGKIDHVSYYRALDTNQVLPGFFRNKVVLIGNQTRVGFT
ncbi:MAG TPA: CHASE2 domain-containing protein, partial [Verrucomicrobiae bacterium]